MAETDYSGLARLLRIKLGLVHGVQASPSIAEVVDFRGSRRLDLGRVVLQVSQLRVVPEGRRVLAVAERVVGFSAGLVGGLALFTGLVLD